MGRLTRRAFLGRSTTTAGGALVALSPAAAMAARGSGRRAGYGPLVEDSGGVIDLPRGFQYRVISAEGDRLSNGTPVPGDHDGMAAFRGPGNTTVLVRNHEIGFRDADEPPVVGRNPYNPAERGGTTGIVVGRDRRKVRDFVTSSGTRVNCAGGATPWGTWLTCEEDRTEGHGYVFEVDPRDPENDLSRTPIRAMGFFSHEAVDIDPRTGIAYLTEDDFRGRIPADPNEETLASRVSFLYRYLPADRHRRPGALHQGGTLQVMTLEESPNFNADLAEPDDKFKVVWRTVNAEEPHADAEAKGGTRFNRLEGCHFAGGAFWFDDTAGGEKRLGQIFRLLPSGSDRDDGDKLELFFEGTSANEMESPDNLIVTPWGDLWFAEDGDGENRVMGITPHGDVYRFASNRVSDSEFAGPCFAPDGRTFFVNIQEPGMTFAIWGPFSRADHGRRRRMAAASPPQGLGPRISGELRDAAERHGMTELQAAAFERKGVSLG